MVVYIGQTSGGGANETLNSGGVRIGTAETYRLIDSIDEVVDSLVVDQNWKNDIIVILFVVLKNVIKLYDKLSEKIKTKIRLDTTPRHAPSIVYQVDAIPHTISGKKVELAVTRILNGEKIDNKEALANPESLKECYQLMNSKTYS